MATARSDADADASRRRRLASICLRPWMSAIVFLRNWIMDCFLVLFTSPVRPIPKEFGKHHVPIGQSAVIVAADSMTTTKVSDLFMMGETDESGNEISGIVVKVTSYSGYEDKDIWEKIRSWQGNE